MTVYYVDPSKTGGDNDGGGDGVDRTDSAEAANWTNAWISLQSALDNCTAGDICYCRGTETLTTSLDVDQNDGSAGSLIKFVGCNASGIIDGTQFVVDGDGVATYCLAFAGKGDYCWWENIRFTGATSHGVNYSALSASNNTWINCRADNNGGSGWQLYYADSTPLSNRFIRCKADSNSTYGFDHLHYGGQFWFCSCFDNGSSGMSRLSGGRSCFIYGCVVHNNGGNGIDVGSSGGAIVNCVIDENDDNGIYTTSVVDVIACRLTDNGKDTSGYGMNNAGIFLGFYGWNYLEGNDSGATNGTVYAIPSNADSNTNETGGTEGYTDGANNDFNLTTPATLRSTAVELQ